MAISTSFHFPKIPKPVGIAISNYGKEYSILEKRLKSSFICILDSDMPDHDLEPPRFAQLALERVLQDWNALKSMIMFGSQENKDPCV